MDGKPVGEPDVGTTGSVKPPRGNRPPRRTVLIVEDTELPAALEIAILAIPGLAVTVASTGQQALQLMESQDEGGICALVTDLHMPRMDGFELIERVRSNQHLKRLPIIVVSGDTDPHTPERIYRLGANAYFAKPYSPSEVRQKLEQLINATSP